MILDHSNKNMIYKKGSSYREGVKGGGVSSLGPDYKQIRITLTVTLLKLVTPKLFNLVTSLYPNLASCVFSEHCSPLPL